jgi:hypothetical protein
MGKYCFLLSENADLAGMPENCEEKVFLLDVFGM